MSKDLSPTMRAAVEYAKKHGNKIVRYPGGFWAREGWAGNEFSYGTSTIEALVSRGLAEYTRYQERKHGGAPFPIEAKLKEAA